MRIKSLGDLSSIVHYFRRIGAEPRSFRTGVVKETKGNYWIDLAIIEIKEDGTVVATDDYKPTDSEQSQIISECKGVQWPTIKKLFRLINLPDELSKTNLENIFEFKDENNMIIMLQQRIELKEGGKIYVPWTYWDDDEWRKMEPDGPLPLWGIDQLQNNSVVFIHEGAKASKYISEMIGCRTPSMKERFTAHPWAEELSDAAHVGWIGGALSPLRTNWKVLNNSGITRAYIVTDNDTKGKSAVTAISKQLKMPTFHIQFTEDWPPGFDLADSFPKHMFSNIDSIEYYIGPSFRKCMHPATWATDLIPNPRGKPSPVLREHFRDQWAYVETIDQFVCLDMPEIIRGEQAANKVLYKFSDTYETTRLIVKGGIDRAVALCYRPSDKGRIITDASSSAINTHIPTDIKPKSGSPAPFLEFMEYLFPIKFEREEVLKWCATLIAKLDVHMEYGMLLISETQGVGKTTLGSAILAPLVGAGGEINVSYPSEAQIQGDFNGWAAQKRLCIFNEIYAGHSFKVYNKLKSLITDSKIDVNEKYQRAYSLDNWLHIFACSNSLEALKIEADDRRWFYPIVTEDRWPPNKFNEFYKWIKCGGLSIIHNWAKNYGSYVRRGESPPMTERKKLSILASRTDGQREAYALAEEMNRMNSPAAIPMKDVEEFIKGKINGRFFDSDISIRKAMKEGGAIVLDHRIYINKRNQLIILNNSAYEELKTDFVLINTKKNVTITGDFKVSDLNDKIRSFIKNPFEILNETM